MNDEGRAHFIQGSKRSSRYSFIGRLFVLPDWAKPLTVPAPPKAEGGREISEIRQYGRTLVPQHGRASIRGASVELLRVVAVVVVVPLLLLVVEFASCVASCPGSVDDEVPSAVKQEAGPPPVVHHAVFANFLGNPLKCAPMRPTWP